MYILATIHTGQALLLSGVWALAAALMGWYIATMAKQITYVTLADGRQQERSIPLIFRLLLPLAPNLRPLVRRPAFAGIRRRLDQQLTAAGYEELMQSEELLALKLLMPLILGPIWMLWVHLCVQS